MARALTVKNLYDKNFDILTIGGSWVEVLGDTESYGAWLIYGKEKNFKTTAALMLANDLSVNYRVLYISAEEGAGKAFRDTLKRIGVDASEQNLHFTEYENLQDVMLRLDKRRSADVVFIDNLTIYNDELKGNALRDLLLRYKTKLFVFVAHEERGEPYTASARLVRKLAKVILHVKGAACNVSGRVKGGTLVIDSEAAKLFHGNQITDNNNNGKQ